MDGIKLILLILVPPLLMFACALAVSLIPLPYPLGRERDLIAAVCFGVLGLVYVGGLTLYVVWSLLSYARGFDPAFTQHGLTASAYMLFGRRYHGSVQGQQVDTYFMPAYRVFYPASLEIRLHTDIQGRVAIGARKPLLRDVDDRRLDLADPDLAHLQVFAPDKAWARALLVHPAAKSAVLRLTADEGGTRGPEVYARPGAWLFRARPGEITADRVEQWLQALMDLADAGGEQP